MFQENALFLFGGFCSMVMYYENKMSVGRVLYVWGGYFFWIGLYGWLCEGGGVICMEVITSGNICVFNFMYELLNFLYQCSSLSCFRKKMKFH